MADPLLIVISGTSGAGKDTVYRGIAPLTLKNKELTPQQEQDLDYLNRTVALEDGLDGLISNEEINQYPFLPELESGFDGNPATTKEKIKNFRSGLLKKLYFVLPLWIARSDASRPKKPGETDDVYRFVTPEQFEEGIRQGRYLEHAVVYGTYKGTPITNVRKILNAGKIPIKLIDPQGAKSVSEYQTTEFKSVVVSLDAPDETLIQRLSGRGRDSKEEIATRINEINRDRQILKSIQPPPIYIENIGHINEIRRKVYNSLVSAGVNI